MISAEGRVPRLVRITGDLIWINFLWLAHCARVTTVLGATAAMYVAVERLHHGDEAPRWREFSAAVATAQQGNRRLAACTTLSFTSAAVVVWFATSQLSLLSGALLGWASVLTTPSLAFAAARQSHEGLQTDVDSWSESVLHRALIAQATTAITRALVHVAMVLVCLLVPLATVVVALSLVGSVPAYFNTRPRGAARPAAIGTPLRRTTV